MAALTFNRQLASYLLKAICLHVSSSLLGSTFYLYMLLSNAQKFAYHAQYYAHDYCNYAQFVYDFINFNDYRCIVRLQINFYLLF